MVSGHAAWVPARARQVRRLKIWVAERPAPVGGDNLAAVDHALKHLARAALADEVSVLAPA